MSNMYNAKLKKKIEKILINKIIKLHQYFEDHSFEDMISQESRTLHNLTFSSLNFVFWEEYDSSKYVEDRSRNFNFISKIGDNPYLLDKINKLPKQVFEINRKELRKKLEKQLLESVYESRGFLQDTRPDSKLKLLLIVIFTETNGYFSGFDKTSDSYPISDDIDYLSYYEDYFLFDYSGDIDFSDAFHPIVAFQEEVGYSTILALKGMSGEYYENLINLYLYEVCLIFHSIFYEPKIMDMLKGPYFEEEVFVYVKNDIDYINIAVTEAAKK